MNDIEINLDALKKNTLNESYVAQFAAKLQYLLARVFAPPLFSSDSPTVRITGTRGDLSNFTNVVSREKKYMDSYLKHGLGDPKVLNDRIALEKAVFRFERDTGLKWPIK